MTIQYGLQMTQKLTDFLNSAKNKQYATQTGTRIHALLRNIVIDDVRGDVGDADIIKNIRNTPDLCKYFCATAKTEVPIAGFINDVFVSRRIDRMIIDDTNKQICFIDYKSDTDKTIFADKYKKQLSEYALLLRSAYPNYKIIGAILWLHDWQIQQIVSL